MRKARAGAFARMKIDQLCLTIIFWQEWMTFWTLRPGINDEVDDSESADKRNAWSAYEAESENKKNDCKDVCCKFCGQQFR